VELASCRSWGRFENTASFQKFQRREKFVRPIPFPPSAERSPDFAYGIPAGLTFPVLDACECEWAHDVEIMSIREDSDASPPKERVHLEKCKICGEWVNRLNLDEVVQHLDHSQRPSPDDSPAQSGSLDQGKRQSA
jgi:hypothetical protein